MKPAKFIQITITLLISLVCFSANAFKVDKMMIIADEKGNGLATLTNDEPRNLFIEATIVELDFAEDGIERIEKQYDRSNLEQWKMSLTHPKVVLKPGETKDIGFRSLCHNVSCDKSKDLMFLVSFRPSTYYAPDEDRSSGVELNVGFSPAFVIPTLEPVLDFTIDYDGDSLAVFNKSNSLIHLLVNGCDSNQAEGCQKAYTVVRGRNRQYTLPSGIQNKSLRIEVRSHDSKYQQEFIINKGGSIQGG